MQESLETRVARLEKSVAAQLELHMILFNLIFTKDAQLGKEVAEALRHLLVSPAAEISPDLTTLIRAMRELLVVPPSESLLEATRQPSIRPVE